MRILFIGDVMGKPGRESVAEHLGAVRATYGVDLTIANVENAAGGIGATGDVIRELFKAGVDVATLGNHTWRQKQFVGELDALPNTVRPANYAEGVPGRGSLVFELADGRRVGVVNLLGRVFMDPVECPFLAARREVDRLRAETPLIVVDIHAEATAEKVAMGWYLDGQCTAVIGTHTHIATADERVLPGGTAYITDVGMAGPYDSVIGMERDRVLRKFLTGMPVEFRAAKENVQFHAVLIEADDASGRARSIARVARP